MGFCVGIREALSAAGKILCHGTGVFIALVARGPRCAGHYRRYTAGRGVRKLMLESAGFEIEYCTYLFTFSSAAADPGA